MRFLLSFKKNPLLCILILGSDSLYDHCKQVRFLFILMQFYVLANQTPHLTVLKGESGSTVYSVFLGSLHLSQVDCLAVLVKNHSVQRHTFFNFFAEFLCKDD